MKSISVIIICHNCKGISICIQSVLGQLSQNDEIILVDDHSTQKFLRKELSFFLTQKSIRFCSVSEKCGSRSYNRNFGAELSKKDILLFLDGDMVPAPGTLQAFRKAHEKDEYVAFIGNAHGMRFAEEHIEFHIGHADYCKLVQTEDGMRQLIQNPLLRDWREYPFQQPCFEPFYWIYYYTCICSAQREVFLKIGGFDEALVTWGSEDIDLGYRLSKYGKIGCVSDAHAVHLPHKRNLWDEQLFDRDNIRYLLDKHRTWPFELLLSFDLSAEIYEMIQSMWEEIKGWDLPRVVPTPISNSLWVNVVSPQHTEDTIIWYDHCSRPSSMGLFGMALPCCDQRFEVAYISAHVFSYPMVMTARILQECMRVSRRVLLMPVSKGHRKLWDNIYILQATEINRNYYLASDTMEFEFVPLLEGAYQVISPQIADRFTASRSHCPILLSALSRQIWHQRLKCEISQITFVNLLEQDTVETRDKLEHALGITFDQSYHFSVPSSSTVSLIEDIPHALISCKSSILFLVPFNDTLTSDSVMQWKRIRNALDFVLCIDGELYCLGDSNPISSEVPKVRH